ncbi:unnamed protein product [Closterium sp. NIES-54]
MRGRLLATFAWWSSWCPYSLVLSVIAKGYWLPWSHGPPQPFHNRNHVGANTLATFTRTAIQELIETGAAVPMPATELTRISPLNVVEQEDKCRLILDLRKVNANLIVPNFKYEGLSRVADLARVGDWMFSIDLKSGYHDIDIHPSCWKFLGFEFDKRTYAFRSLPFGLATAPFVFTQLIKQLARRWREQGNRVIPYVDDILFLCQSKAHAQAICQRVILDHKELGTRLIIEWIPRELNSHADELSKMVDHDDYALKMPWFRILERPWGPHSIDLFANSRNTQLLCFCTKIPHPEAIAVDAFSIA